MAGTVEKLMELASRRFGVEFETLSAQQDFFQVLGINSIQALELLTDVELEFDVEIPDYELQGLVTFAALAALIDKRR